MTAMLDDRSMHRLRGVHDDLARVVIRASEITPLPFIVTEGLRTPDRQAKLVAAGASQTMKSRHLTGHAVDVAAVVDGEVRWDWPLYDQLADAFKEAAYIENVVIEWGGDWKMRDGPHYQLPWQTHPLLTEV